jgi:hypothetical protein
MLNLGLQIERYLDIFDAEQVKVLVFEEFVQNTNSALNDILRFLDVRPNCILNSLSIV